ncbi:hypothetical protein BJ138DRAFT_1006882 [Hygrophoropsis aurantiaca]|uniref:Uncharacterized protein n=1 Tax=Hygrophoropsis aurantiaca TaxID=72124 RepID=A0ACB8AEM1_9AGAM|nr:hypothetical protein BJ138DRAFT_1006882 [Hygrophoropsis aurantiaca]
MKSITYQVAAILTGCLVFATASPAPLSDKCYYLPLPNIPPSAANRTVPWGEPTITFPNGTTCCSSLDQVRTQLDTIDAQLLEVLAQRAAYVAEATRFKPTESSVDVPSRDQQVLQEAVDGAPAVHLPQIIAQQVYESILNASIYFEDCIVRLFFDCYRHIGQLG